MPTAHTDDDKRRAYWAQQMDMAYDFMQGMLDVPVEECGELFVGLREAADVGAVEVLFSDTKVVKGIDRMFYLRQGLIDPFIAAAGEFNDRGLLLKVEDGFRTREIQKNLALSPRIFESILDKVIWELGGSVPSPRFAAKRLSSLIAYSPKVGTHMSCSAIDISVFGRDDRTEVDRGKPYLEMSELTPMESPFISDEAVQNRRMINTVMRNHGFIAYPWEFWHFNSGDAYAEYLCKTGRPGRYGPVDFDIDTGQIAPIANPNEALNSDEEIQQMIDNALEKLK